MRKHKKYFIWSLVIGFVVLPASVYLFSAGVFGDDDVKNVEMKNYYISNNDEKDDNGDIKKEDEIKEIDDVKNNDEDDYDRNEMNRNMEKNTIRNEIIEKYNNENRKKENEILSKVKIKVNPEKVVNNNTEKVNFTAKTELKVRKVEYYLDDGETDDTYLGSAQKIEENLRTPEDGQEEKWQLTVDLEKRIPNGKYDVYAKIKDKNGQETETERMKLEVKKRTQASENEQGMNIERKKMNNDDYDGDGVSNEDEKRLGTNPYLADSDNDGYTDGDEIRNGYDPLKASNGDKSDKVVFQTPKTNGNVDLKYEVTEVKMERNEKKNKIKFAGKALPNTFIRLFIYSEQPIIVTVKTDEDGNWSYELDKELDNGQHEVYVTVTDNTGKITSKSKSLAFVKTAEAVSITPIADSKTTEALTKKFGMENIAYLIIIIIASFSLAMILIKKIMSRKTNVEG